MIFDACKFDINDVVIWVAETHIYCGILKNFRGELQGSWVSKVSACVPLWSFQAKLLFQETFEDVSPHGPYMFSNLL